MHVACGSRWTVRIRQIQVRIRTSDVLRRMQTDREGIVFVLRFPGIVNGENGVRVVEETFSLGM